MPLAVMVLQGGQCGVRCLRVSQGKDRVRGAEGVRAAGAGVLPVLTLAQACSHSTKGFTQLLPAGPLLRINALSSCQCPPPTPPPL